MSANLLDTAAAARARRESEISRENETSARSVTRAVALPPSLRRVQARSDGNTVKIGPQ